MNIYVGNLTYDVTEEDLEALFAEFGTVKSVKIVSDFNSGRSKGFGFVEMEDTDEGQEAIDKLDGSDFQGRNLKVNLARPRRQPRFNGGGGRQGGGDDGGGGGRY